MDAVATESHFLDHLAPIWLALPDRGRLLVDAALMPRAIAKGIDASLIDAQAVRQSMGQQPPRFDGPPCLVASIGDIKVARRMGYGPFVFLDEIKPELVAIAEAYGFYVAGGGTFGHTGMRQRMWRYVSKRATGEYVFGSEDDFVFTSPVDLRSMMETLAENRHLAQLALLREPAYAKERERGGILGHPLEAFVPAGVNGSARLEHRVFWTNNASLFRRSLTATPWPASRESSGGKGSEVVFADALRSDPDVRFAFWGTGEATIRHIGETRAGYGY